MAMMIPISDQLNSSYENKRMGMYIENHAKQVWSRKCASVIRRSDGLDKNALLTTPSSEFLAGYETRGNTHSVSKIKGTRAMAETTKTLQY
jgi:hypothetical protein